MLGAFALLAGFHFGSVIEHGGLPLMIAPVLLPEGWFRAATRAWRTA